MAGGVIADHDVVRHRQIIHKQNFLVNNGDPCSGGIQRAVKMHFLTVYADTTLIRAALIGTAYYFQKRRLSRAVFPADSQNLALLQLQGDIIQGNDPGKYLCNMAHF